MIARIALTVLLLMGISFSASAQAVDSESAAVQHAVTVLKQNELLPVPEKCVMSDVDKAVSAYFVVDLREKHGEGCAANEDSEGGNEPTEIITVRVKKQDGAIEAFDGETYYSLEKFKAALHEEDDGQ